MELETSLLRVPIESATRVFRNSQKQLEKDLEIVQKAFNDIAKKKELPKSAVLDNIDKITKKLESMKRNVESAQSQEAELIKRCYCRVDYLAQHPQYRHQLFSELAVSFELKRKQKLDPIQRKNSNDNGDADMKDEDQSKPPSSSSNGLVDGEDTDDDDEVVDEDGVAMKDDGDDEEDVYDEEAEIIKYFGSILANPRSASEFSKTRMLRILSDYLLRNGTLKTAQLLAKEAKIEGLIDPEVFETAKKVELGLQKHDCKEALAWCKDNSSKLRKISSRLELDLRFQEFIELVRANKMMDAITYSRKHLAPAAMASPDQMSQLQRTMACVAYPGGRNAAEPYKTLFSPERWNTLVASFHRTNCEVHGLSLDPLLKITLQAGLSALKTTQCFHLLGSSASPLPASSESSRSSMVMESTGHNPNCPVCVDPLHTIAAKLPFSHHIHSTLVCRLTGQVMNEDNPPLVLPNGNVYSKYAMMEMSAKNKGIITDPQTGLICHYDHLKKAFIS